MGSVTISNTTVDIFGSLDNANSYFVVSLAGPNWENASQTNKSKALVTGTRWLTQVGLVDPDSGEAIVPSSDDSGVPVQVQEANYELADILLGDATALNNANTGSNIKIAKAGSAQVEFFRPTEGSVFPDSVMRLISPYLASTTSGSSLTGFAGGSDASSSFCDAEAPAVSEGYA